MDEHWSQLPVGTVAAPSGWFVPDSMRGQFVDHQLWGGDANALEMATSTREWTRLEQGLCWGENVLIDQECSLRGKTSKSAWDLGQSYGSQKPFDMEQTALPQLTENFSSFHCRADLLILDCNSDGIALENDENWKHRELLNGLPDDLLERIFAALPLLSLFRARAVCKRWNLVIDSSSFRALCAQHANHKPWYLMYKDSEKPVVVAFDPSSKRWHNFVLPHFDPMTSFVASADGLVCFMDKTNCDMIYVCNPMTKAWRVLPKPPDHWISDYCAVSMTIGKDQKTYKIVIARSKQVPDDYTQWDFSIEVYDSALDSWMSSSSKVLKGWRAGEESNICNDMFYCVTHPTFGVGQDNSRHGLIVYDLCTTTFQDIILPMPCSLSCVRLLSRWDRLIMVGGIGTYDFIKGVGVWELDTEWKQIARMPTKLFHGFIGGLDDVFSCCGHGDLVYIHSYGSPQLMVHDISQGSWNWARACPTLRRDPLHLFAGFCFQPRLDILV